jgi:hypothetical protein
MITMASVSNLPSLGEDQDRVDAAAVIGIFASTVSHPDLPAPSGRPSDLGKIRRMTLDAIWEWPRRKDWRPLNVPWSADARAVYEADPRAATRNLGMGLVTEHVVPVNVIISVLMAGEQTVDAYLGVLRSLCILSVITKAEDARLTATGFAHYHPDPTDPWSRPRAAGLDVDDFALPVQPQSASPVQARPRTPTMSITASGRECPHCQAQPGQPCRTKDGGLSVNPHGRRVMG